MLKLGCSTNLNPENPDSDNWRGNTEQDREFKV